MITSRCAVFVRQSRGSPLEVLCAVVRRSPLFFGRSPCCSEVHLRDSSSLGKGTRTQRYYHLLVNFCHQMAREDRLAAVYAAYGTVRTEARHAAALVLNFVSTFSLSQSLLEISQERIFKPQDVLMLVDFSGCRTPSCQRWHDDHTAGTICSMPYKK